MHPLNGLFPLPVHPSYPSFPSTYDVHRDQAALVVDTPTRQAETLSGRLRVRPDCRKRALTKRLTSRRTLLVSDVAGHYPRSRLKKPSPPSHFTRSVLISSALGSGDLAPRHIILLTTDGGTAVVMPWWKQPIVHKRQLIKQISTLDLMGSNPGADTRPLAAARMLLSSKLGMFSCRQRRLTTGHLGRTLPTSVC